MVLREREGNKEEREEGDVSKPNPSFKSRHQFQYRIIIQDLPHDTSNDGHGSSTPMDFIPSQFVSSSIDLFLYPPKVSHKGPVFFVTVTPPLFFLLLIVSVLLLS
jgi:hypothetical protein